MSQIPTRKYTVNDPTHANDEIITFLKSLQAAGEPPRCEVRYPAPPYVDADAWAKRQEESFDALELVDGELRTLPPYAELDGGAIVIVLWPNGSRTSPTLGSGYGPRESFWTPGGWTNPFHYGQDCFGFPLNRAIADGVVTYVGYNGGFGNYVRVRHDDGYSSGYAHGAPAGFRVGVGQRVTAGSSLMVQGTTGRSTGVHLHFEVYDRNGNTIDPAEYVRSRLGGSAASGGNARPFEPEPAPTQSEEDDMSITLIRITDGPSRGTSYSIFPGRGIMAHQNVEGARAALFALNRTDPPAAGDEFEAFRKKDGSGELQVTETRARWIMDVLGLSRLLKSGFPGPGDTWYI